MQVKSPPADRSNITYAYSRIGSLQLAMPVVTIAAAALVLDEVVTAQIALTTVIIIAGAWWAHRSAS